MASLAPNTLSQYNSSLKAFWEFCQAKKFDYCNVSITQVIVFLTERFESGASYSTLNTTRSALSLVLGTNLTSDDNIIRLLKGVFRLKPPSPKYEFAWDTNIVLNYLSNYYPYDDINLRDLSLKTATLLALASAQRIQTLSLINVQNVTLNDSTIIIKIVDLIKTSRPGACQPLIRLPYITENPKICPALALRMYLNKTRDLRVNSNDKLFISFKKPHKQVGSQTIGHWLKDVLQKSGVDTSVYGAHSTRHASTSAARRAGVSLQAIRRAAGWSDSSNVFLKYYNREILTSNQDKEFVSSVFDCKGNQSTF